MYQVKQLSLLSLSFVITFLLIINFPIPVLADGSNFNTEGSGLKPHYPGQMLKKGDVKVDQDFNKKNPATTQQNWIEPDTDRPGSDYKNFWTSGGPEQCQEACTDDLNCKSYTYVRPGIQGSQARCWLKSGVPSPLSNRCCVSGVKKTISATKEVQRIQPTLPQPRIKNNKESLGQNSYFDGHVLGDKNFKDEQEYHREKRKSSGTTKKSLETAQRQFGPIGPSEKITKSLKKNDPSKREIETYGIGPETGSTLFGDTPKGLIPPPVRPKVGSQSFFDKPQGSSSSPVSPFDDILKSIGPEREFTIPAPPTRQTPQQQFMGRTYDSNTFNTGAGVDISQPYGPPVKDPSFTNTEIKIRQALDAVKQYKKEALTAINEIEFKVNQLIPLINSCPTFQDPLGSGLFPSLLNTLMPGQSVSAPIALPLVRRSCNDYYTSVRRAKNDAKMNMDKIKSFLSDVNSMSHTLTTLCRVKGKGLSQPTKSALQNRLVSSKRIVQSKKDTFDKSIRFIQELMEQYKECMSSPTYVEDLIP